MKLLVFFLAVVLQCTSTKGTGLDVQIRVDYSPPPGFVPDLNEYRAASGPVTVACIATGGNGTMNYTWSSTCRECPFQRGYYYNGLQFIRRAAVHSGDNGTHTCTVNDAIGNSGSASIQMIIKGAGIYTFSGVPRGYSSDNSLVVSSYSDNGFYFRFFCRSDSMIENVGILIGLDGKTVVTTNNIFHIENRLAGELYVSSRVPYQDPISLNKQGVYTCRIPLQSGEIRDINIGIYAIGFITPPSIVNVDYVLNQNPLPSTLNCTSTGSPATNVAWMRDGQPLTIDGTTYQLIQTVTNRTESTYENILTVNDQPGNIIGHKYTCTVTNALGSASLQIKTSPPIPPTPDVELVAVSPTAIKISWQSERNTVDCYRIKYKRNTGAMQQGPCLYEYSDTLTVDGEEMEYDIIITQLEEFSTYTFNVSAGNAAGYSTPSSGQVTTWQAAPSSSPMWLNSTATTSTTITIQWDAVPCMDQNSEITGYKVHYGPVGSSQRATDAVYGSASTGGMYTLTGLIPFTNYSIEVAAVNSNGDIGPFTLPVPDSTIQIESFPRNIHLRAVNSTAVHVSWSTFNLPGWNRLSYYTIYYSTISESQSTIVDASAFSGSTASTIVSISELAIGHKYQFQVSGGLRIEGIYYKGPRSEKANITYDLNVSIHIGYSPPPGFVLGLNEYRAASGPVTVTCRALETIGAITYHWTSTCRSCPFQYNTHSSTRRAFLHSGDNGTHTCTVNDRSGRAGSASIVMNVVGAGIYVTRGSPNQRYTTLANNGLIISDNDDHPYHFRFFCRSDSMIDNVGKLIGLDGSTAITSNSFFNIRNAQPGELEVTNTVDLQTLPSSEQGVYTCRIPLDSGELREINIGIYPSRFNTTPSIPNCLVLTTGSSSSTLTCNSTGSPATTVTWMRDGQPLTIDASLYQLTQTVTNRAESTYMNVLTINDQLNTTVDHTYTCTVNNVLGTASRDLIATTPQVPECHAEGFSPTSIKLSWSQPSNCHVEYFHIEWTTTAKQLKECPKLIESGSVNVKADVTEYILTELEIFHAYTIKITAKNMIGNSTCSQDITTSPASPSSAPEWVNGTATTSTTITIQWGAVPCMDQNSEITGYKVRYGPVGSSQRATDAVSVSGSTGGMYTLTGLIPFTNYSTEVAAVNTNGDTGPFSLPHFAETLIPPPTNINFEAVNATAVKVSWTKLQLPHWNLSHYTVYYTATKQGRVIDQYYTIIKISGNPTMSSAVVVLRNLMPGLVHQFQASCSLQTEKGRLVEGPRSMNQRFTFDQELFQIQIGPVEHCITWQPGKAEKIDAIIHYALAEAISCQCNCTFPYEFIRRGKFSCRNTTTRVSYRSTIVGTKAHNASQLVNFIQKWVSTGPFLEVEWWLLDVYADCPVRISSPNDSECQGSKPVACNPTMMAGDPLLFKCVQQND